MRTHRPVLLIAMLVATRARAATTRWELKDVKLLNGGPSYMTVLQQNAGPTGGTLLINVSGAANNTCSSPDGVTQMRFTWTFDKNVAFVDPGEQFGASLRAEQMTMPGTTVGALKEAETGVRVAM